MSEKTPKIICTTVLVETSPQAMPLGAACIASALKADKSLSGFAVELVDFSREDEDFINAVGQGGESRAAEFIAGKLAEKKPFAVCFSVYVWNHVILDKCAGELKKLFPDCVTIAGGPEVTADPLNFSNFDYTIAGQGESAVPALIQKLSSECADSSAAESDGSVFQIPGVYSLSAGHRKHSLSVFRATPCSPESVSSPYLDGTLDPAKYGGALWELARGCPFKCSYCYESKGEKKIAYFPLERLEKELVLFAKKKIAQVFVLDPTYNASKERAIKMLGMIRKKAPGMFFYFEARAEFIDREIAKAFSKIPCCIQFGLQSSNPEVLKKVHRTLDKKQFARNIGFLNETGVTFGFDLIYGLPGDTFSGFKNSIDFALGLYPNNLELFCLSVLPGTNLHDDAPSYGMVWDENPPYHVLRTPQFSESDLAKARKLAEATNLFYTQGRAVPWFNSVLYALKEKPSDFLWDFAAFLGEKHGADSVGKMSSAEITEIQKEFVREKFRAKKLNRFVPVAEDLISMHGALGLCTFDGTKSVFTTNYHPDDIMSGYATDLDFFSKNAGKQRCRVCVFEGKNGADWKTV